MNGLDQAHSYHSHATQANGVVIKMRNADGAGLGGGKIQWAWM